MNRFFATIVHTFLVLALFPFAVACAAELTVPAGSKLTPEQASQPVKEIQPSGHRREISVFALSRDGRYALTGDADENNFLWDLKSGKLLREIGKPDQLRLRVLAAAFSPDSSTLLWARFRKHMPLLWDVKSGKRLGVLASKVNGHKAEIVSLAFSDDGRYAATGDMQGMVILWSMKDRSLLRRIKAHAGEVNQLVFVPGGGELASAGMDGAVRLWGVEKNEPLATLLNPSDVPITALAVSADGSVMYAASEDMTVKGWNVPLRTLRTTISFKDRQINGIAVSPAGDLLAVIEEDNSVLLWNIRENRVAWRNELDESAMSARFSPEGASLYTAGGDNWIREWQVSSGKLIRKFGGVVE
ncbi:MAG: WD40 repeat domain-containing protein [Steroidobacteraceae bacterium]|nr:WD40 repeat domain-containing protein [Deltaproteobacteria bacterium]